MLRRTVLSTLAVLSLTSAAFGGVIWSSAGSISGQYSAVVHPSELNSEGEFVDLPDLNFSGPGGVALYGDHWGFVFDYGASKTGGSTYANTLGGDANFGWSHMTGTTELNVFGALLVPGTGTTKIQFDMLYDWMDGGVSSGWGQGLTPTLILAGSHVPIAVDVILFGGQPEHDCGFFAGKAVATVERGTPTLFSITYNSVFSQYSGNPSASTTTDFNLEGITEVQPASTVPEPASIALTAVALLALAAWKSRRRSCGAYHCR